MAAVPEGPSPYDVHGTVLYRVVDEHTYRAELLPRAATPAPVAADASPQPSTQQPHATFLGTASSRSGLKGSRMSVAGQRGAGATPATGRLAPLTASGSGRTPAAATATAAATPAPAGATSTGDDTALAARLMLDHLFPPTPLDGEGRELGELAEGAEDALAGDSETASAARRSPALSAAAAARGQSPAPNEPGSNAALMPNSSRALTTATWAAGGAQGEGGSHTQQPRWLRVAAVDHTARLDVVLLKQHLERRCVEENARPRGTLCPTRAQIFKDGMQELIRQVTVSCPERGMLLRNLCDSMDQTTGTYDALFDSARQYAVRKSTERDLKHHLFDDRHALERECRRCENRVHELRAKYAGMRKRAEEQRAAADKVREAEINYVKLSNQQIVAEIKRVMSATEGSGAK